MSSLTSPLLYLFSNAFPCSLAFTPLLVSYSIEILPYNIRAKGFTVMNFVVSVALVFNQYVNPIALEALSWKYYVRIPLARCRIVTHPLLISQVVYCCWLLVETIYCYFFIVETRGRSLEETATIFDGEDMVQKVAAAGYEVREDHVYDDKGSDSYQIPEKTV